MALGCLFCAVVCVVLLPLTTGGQSKPFGDAYRLGDAVNGFQAKFRSNGWKAVRDHYKTVHPGSIAAEYLNVAAKKPKHYRANDLNLLAHIVEQRFHEWPQVEKGEDGVGLMGSLPGDATLVAHVRLGDVSEGLGREPGQAYTAAEMFQDGVWIGPVKTMYVQPRSYYERVIADLPSTVNQVVLIASFKHNAKNGSDHHASIGYRNLLAQLFECKGFTVVHRFERDPDADFIFASHAKYFAVSGGGYSTLMGDCAYRLGGTVFTCGDSSAVCKYKVRHHKRRSRRIVASTNPKPSITRPSCP